MIKPLPAMLLRTFSLAAVVTFLGLPAFAEGTLTINASGEERAIAGFTSKDGWALSFEEITVAISDIVAYQSNPPFDALGEAELVAIAQVEAADSYTVNLTDAIAVPVTTLSAPAGRYNALAFVLESPLSDRGALNLVGSAARAGETVAFSLELLPTVAYLCGDYVGDDRKGFLDAGGEADLEITLHLDHLFGDADKDPADALNQTALGFDLIASLAIDGTATLTSADLAEALGEAGYAAFLTDVMTELGHVGEGHCRAELL